MDLIDQEKGNLENLKNKINGILRKIDFCSLVNLEDLEKQKIERIPILEYLLFFVSAKNRNFVEESFRRFLEVNLTTLFFNKEEL